MKIKIKKLLKEAKTAGSEEIERIRINLGIKIHEFIMSPTINMGDPKDLLYDEDEDGNLYKRPFRKSDTTMLLYLYKGISSSGKLGEEENIGAVVNEISKRVEMFIEASDPKEKAVFLSDSPELIKYLKDSRRPQAEGTYETMYLGAYAPGSFTHFDFAKRQRAIYKDTTTYGGAIDFMLKKTPELKNINPDSQWLFKLENIIKKAATQVSKESYSKEMYQKVEPLSFDQYFANYNQGTSEDRIKEEKAEYRPIYQSDNPVEIYYYNLKNKLLSFLYKEIDKMAGSPSAQSPNQEQGIISAANSDLREFLQKQRSLLNKEIFSEPLVRLKMMIERGMIKEKYYIKNNKLIDSLLKKNNELGYPDTLDENLFWFPLDKTKIPKEDRTHPDDIQRKVEEKLRRFESQVIYLRKKIDNKKGINQTEIEDLYASFENLSREQKKEFALPILIKHNINSRTLIATNSPKEIEIEKEQTVYDPVEEVHLILLEMASDLQAQEEIPQESYKEIMEIINKSNADQTKKIHQLLQQFKTEWGI